MKPMSLEERIDKFSCYTGDCIVWVGQLGFKNYPSITINGETKLVHRVNYKLYYGDFDESLQIDHLCSNPPCINPAHLEAVDQSENMRRAYKRAPRNKPTHCKKGHEFKEPDVIHHHGTRQCRICYNEWQRNYRKNKA